MIYADAGKALQRIADSMVVGSSYALGYLYYLNGELLPTPILEKPEDFAEITKEQHDEQIRPLYVAKVEEFIREVYSVSDELAIQRQRDTKPDNFRVYFDFCEDCKSRARAEIDAKYPFIIDPVEPETES